MRLFAALEIAANVRNNLAELLRELRAISGSDKAARWVRAENLHVTLKFMGEVPAEKLEAIRNALASVRAKGRFEALCRGTGFFPDERHPQVFWAGIDADDQLPQLAAGIDDALATIGFPREKRKFHPHVTLARFGAPRLSDSLRNALSTLPPRTFGSFQIRDFQLMASATKPSGAEYTRIQFFPLAEA